MLPLSACCYTALAILPLTIPAALLIAQAAGPPNDPSTNPVLLPPRTRTDIVQDRPAGGTPEEVAAANPALAAAVPETVGKDSDAGECYQAPG